MKKFKYDMNNSILEKISYVDTQQLKFLIKYLANMDENFFKDMTLMCLIIDLKTVLGLYPNANNNIKVLSDKQRDILIRHLINDEPQKEIAKDYGITQQGVSVIINTALKRIRQYLTEGSVTRVHWSEEDKRFLLENFNKLPLEELEKRLKIPANRIISMYYYLRNKYKKEGEG